MAVKNHGDGVAESARIWDNNVVTFLRKKKGDSHVALYLDGSGFKLYSSNHPSPLHSNMEYRLRRLLEFIQKEHKS